MAKVQGVDKENEFSYIETGSAISRTSGQPIDPTTIWYSLDDAKDYATREDSQAYVGQQLTVLDDNNSGVYIITDTEGDNLQLLQKISFSNRIVEESSPNTSGLAYEVSKSPSTDHPLIDPSTNAKFTAWLIYAKQDGSYGSITGFGDAVGDTIYIPSHIGENPICSIDSEAFAANGFSSVSKFVLPYTLRLIGKHAFKGRSNTVIAIPGNPPASLHRGVLYENITGLMLLGTGLKMHPKAYTIIPPNGSTNGDVDSGIHDEAFDGVTDAMIEIYSTGDDFLYYDRAAILDYRFYKCKAFNNIVTITSDFKVIRPFAFYGCENIKKLNLPNTLTHIYDNAFTNCKSISTLTLPDSVMHIGQYAFFGMEALKEVKLSKKLTEIPTRAFGFCSSLSNITLPDKLTRIGMEAFMNCTTLETINIPDSVTHIDDGAFSNTAITEITLGRGIKEIGEMAFSNCANLKKIIVPWDPDTIPGAPWGADTVIIEYNASLPSHSAAPIGNTKQTYSVTYRPNTSESWAISNYNYSPAGMISTALDRKYSNVSIPLEYEDLPVTELDFRAFDSAKIQSVHISKNVESIAHNPFTNCPRLQSISMDPANTNFRTDTVNCIVRNGSLISGCKNTIIPDDIFYIENTAFMGATGLTEIDIPESVLSIQASAFKDCTNLKRASKDTDIAGFVDRDTLVGVGASAFENTALERVVISGDSIKNIGQKAFKDCKSLTTCKLGNGANANQLTIYHGPLTGCTNLTDLTVQFIGKTEANPGDTAFLGYLYGLESSDDHAADCSSGGAMSALTNLTISPDESYTVPAFSCAGISNLRTLTLIGLGLTIGEGAFQNCTSLTHVLFDDHPDTIDRMHDDVFDGCDNIRIISTAVGSYEKWETKTRDWGQWEPSNPNFAVITDNSSTGYTADMNPYATSIRPLHFNGVGRLQHINVHGSITSIEYGAFYECSDVNTIQFAYPSSVAFIGAEAFGYCTSLTTVNLSNTTITALSNWLFTGCTNLTSIHIPKTVTAICKEVLDGCWNLMTITFYGTKAEWAAITKDSTWKNNCVDGWEVQCTDGTLTKEEA